MANILACTDGSAYAASVYDHAAWAAHRMAASVEVLNVLDQHREKPALADNSGAIGFDARDELLEQLAELEEAKGKVAQKQSRLILQEASARLLAAGIADVKLTQRHGSLLEALEEAEKRIDLVVIGKRGEDSAPDDRIGANIEKVARASAHPVLIASRAFHPIDRAVIAFDNGPSVRKAIECMAQKPLLKGLACQLVAAGPLSREIEDGLAWASDQLAGAGFDAKTTIGLGEPDDVIRKAIGPEPGALLVMGAYSHSRIRQFLLGSMTSAMVRACHVPVLAFH